MLTPTKLDKLPDSMISLMSELQDEIIADICRRITKANYLTPTAEWQLYKANQLKLSSPQINKIIAKQLKLREKTVRELYTDTVKTAISEDAEIYRIAIKAGLLGDKYSKKLSSYTRSVAFSNALKKGLQATNGLMRNLTRTTALNANRELSDALDLAYLKVINGAFSPADAIFDAVKKLGVNGIKTVSYKSGRSDQLDVAVRRAVLTGINKTCCDMQLELAKEMDCDLVEVSSHFGARPTHADWQGQVYSLTKGHKKYPYFYDATEFGTGDGLGGWNCRHSFFPFFEGISEIANAPDFSKSENLQEYNESQQQRAFERAIRKNKRELIAIDSSRNAASDTALIDKLDRQFAKKSVSLKTKEARLDDFLKATNRLPDGSRVRVDGFGRSVSQKAVWADKKGLQKVNKSGIINVGSDNVQLLNRKANGLRKSATLPLSNEDIIFLKSEIKNIGADENIFIFNSGVSTGYNDKYDIIRITSNVFPDENSLHPRDLMSARAVLAHEYYGHRAYRNTKLAPGSWNDEFRASYSAAKNCPNLSLQDRAYLIMDAIERAKEVGVTIKYNEFMRRVLYGY